MLYEMKNSKWYWNASLEKIVRIIPIYTPGANFRDICIRLCIVVIPWKLRMLEIIGSVLTPMKIPSKVSSTKKETQEVGRFFF